MIAGRDEILELRAAEPLDARVTVAEITLPRGITFQVTAQWHSRGQRPAHGQVDHRDTFVRYYEAGTARLGKAIAHAAHARLRDGREADLQAIARQLKASGEAPGTDRRQGLRGAILLGDTAPDERAE